MFLELVGLLRREYCVSRCAEMILMRSDVCTIEHYKEILIELVKSKTIFDCIGASFKDFKIYSTILFE